MIRILASKRLTFTEFNLCRNFSSDTINHIICEDVTPNIKRIILNNPKKRNSFSINFMTAIENTLMDIKANCEANNSNIKAVILKSSSKTFSGGHDLLEFKNGDKPVRKAVFDKAHSLMNTLENYFIPVIVSIHGPAAAAGCQLVASCDIAVCSETATFSTPGILAGLFCSTPGVAVGRSVPRKIALEMVLTDANRCFLEQSDAIEPCLLVQYSHGEPISAQKALAYGLVNHVVPIEDVDIVSEKIAEKICSLSSPIIKLGKMVFINQMKLSKEEAYKYAGTMMVENLDHGDCVEGIDAFLEKRSPKWTQ